MTDLSCLLFGVTTAALVIAGPEGLVVSGADGASADQARAAACRLFEILAASDAGPEADRAGVLEEVVPGRGFVAAAPIVPAGGRCLGAICLMDSGRLGLLSDFQRRLLAEVGALVASRLDAPRAASPGGDALSRAADREDEAFALFDRDGRCLLRNGRFGALLDLAASGAASEAALADARGREAAWIGARLMREQAPVGVYRTALPDGSWLSVEERRGAHGRSLIARMDDGEGFGDPEAQLLFERCPSPMFVFADDTGCILAANAAALSFYGWDRDAFLSLDLGAIGPVPRGETQGGAWMHRARDGRPLAVTGRATALRHRGRPAVLVTVAATPAALVRLA